MGGFVCLFVLVRSTVIVKQLAPTTSQSLNNNNYLFIYLLFIYLKF